MQLTDTLKQQIIASMKAGTTERTTVLRFLNAQLQNAQIDKGADAQLTDDEGLRIIEREAKKRREAAAAYEQGGSPDRAASERAELDIIMEFLPAQLTDDEVRALISAAQASGAADFNALIKVVSAQTRGRADGARVAELVRTATSA